ncbi:ABC transporter ATP-binding protein [Roseibium sp. SCP14]|uniref:ABC transporter ATP-binding protein n=1 Tax=Roseibium sp. SCP14 TaxID=3141375 RepID=UPI00333A2715
MTELILSNIGKKFGSFTAVREANLRLDDGSFVCFLGPSGCGKTTLLRLIAGLEIPTAGEILVDGADITRLPAHRREIGMVFQSLALFPHLNVEENVAYGMRLRKMRKDQALRKARELLELVKLPHIAKREITELSGGQRQRVAIARALALQPKLFLLDEPLSALDANLREEMQVELKQLQRRLGVTTVMVTHDQSEAMTAADVIVVMSAGRIEQIGHPLDVYQHPANRFVAGFVGANNLIDGVRIKDATSVECFGESLRVEHMQTDVQAGSDVTLSIRPEDVELTETTDGENIVRGQVSFVRDLGFEVEAYVMVGDVRLTAKWMPKADPTIREGDTVGLFLDPSDIRVHLS